MSSRTGGPAFPTPNTVYPDGVTQYGEYGMMLRDWFAGQALTGMIASAPCSDRSIEAVRHDKWAENAYAFADAMLKAREAQS